MTAVPEEIQALGDRMTEWRREIHAHPELAFAEHRTAAFVADRLREMGLDVVTGVGQTGVVATLQAGDAGGAIGLRAELDALPITERTGLPYASREPGVMHACGHDGHCAMLLGAAAHLSGVEELSGTVRFIFQPAEENEGGARVMIEDGLFERFPVHSVYAIHNEPGMPEGTFAVRPGPVTASLDLFEIKVTGREAHAARPHRGADAIVCSAAIVSALQTIRARELDPLDVGVLSVTRIEGGNSWNVLPRSVRLRGTVRTLREQVRETLETRLRDIAEGLTATYGCSASIKYERRYPSTSNAEPQVAAAASAARRVFGADRVDPDRPPTTAAEDFAFMQRERPGCYAFLGTGGPAPVHTPEYDFNDDVLVWGAAFWVELARSLLPANGG